METIDLKTLTEEEFEHHRSDLMVELERRNKLREAPIQIKSIAAEYEAMGGDKNDLFSAINEDFATEAPEETPETPEE